MAEHCSVTVPHEQNMSSYCYNPVSLHVDGKAYCALHDPAKVALRRERLTAKWCAKWAAEDQAREEGRARELEQQRRAACYDDLLAACKAIARLLPYPDLPGPIYISIEEANQIMAAIAKAEEVQSWQPQRASP